MYIYRVYLPQNLVLEVLLKEGEETYFEVKFPNGGAVQFDYKGGEDGNVRTGAGLTAPKQLPAAGGRGKRFEVKQLPAETRTEGDGDPAIEYSDPEMGGN